VIEAFQMTTERREDNREWPDWLNQAWQKECDQDGSLFPTIQGSEIDRTLSIFTLEGPHLVSWGDWIIQGVNGEIYPCKPDIFEKTYEAVE
jgi:sulfatase maturation enzyme AslB (radical SAM superfamily)